MYLQPVSYVQLMQHVVLHSVGHLIGQLAVVTIIYRDLLQLLLLR